MSRINVHSSPTRRGFTLVEMMVSLGVSAIVIGGVLAAYLFLGRNLTRMANVQHQQVQSRRTLRTFTQDLSAANALSTATATQVALTRPVSNGTASVSYTYDSGSGTLTRTETLPSSSPTTQTILSNLTSFSFNYYNSGGASVTSSPQSVKTVEFTYSAAEGDANNGTQITYRSVSPRVVMRNKPLLQ